MIVLRGQATVDQPAKHGVTPLSQAAAQGDDLALIMLLKHRADPNLVDQARFVCVDEQA